MNWTYSPGSSDRDTLRLLALDADENVQLFSDEEMDVFLALEQGDVRYAAAAVVERIANNQAMILRITQVNGVTVNGVAGAKVMTDYAASLRKQSDQQVDFDIAEQVWTPSGFAQRVWNQRLREGA